MRIARTIVSVIVSLGVTACGGPSRSPVGPTSASAAGFGGSVSGIRGFVVDSAFRPLAGARVEAVDGASAGASTIADSEGQFSLGGTFTSTDRFRATKDGYVTATQPWNCSIGASCPGANPWLGFSLAPIEPSVNIAGDYTLTFTADPGCASLPVEARVRTYPATIAASPHLTAPAVHVTAGGALFLSAYWGPLNGFDIGVAGNYLSFSLDGGNDPPVVEQLGPSTYVAFSGVGAASVATPPASTISTFFDGWIDYCVMPTPMHPDTSYNCGTSYTTGEAIPGAAVVYAHCESTAHRLTLTRR